MPKPKKRTNYNSTRLMVFVFSIGSMLLNGAYVSIATAETVVNRQTESQPDTRKITLCQPNGGPCVNHKRIFDALQEMKTGSALKFASGRYTDSAVINENNVTITGEPGAAIIGIADGKATFVAAGDNLVFDNLDISLPAGSATTNEACFRGEGKNLTLKNIHCHDNQMGIIGGPGTLTIEHSTFENSGINANGNLGHMVYACSNTLCPEGSLIIRDSKFIRMGLNRPGHAIKSRAPKNLIENVVISSLGANSGRAIDISQGGETVIRNTVMQFGVNGDNADFIGIALEGDKFPLHNNTNTLIENVIAICDRSQPCDFVRYVGNAPILKNIVLIGHFKFYDDLYPLAKDGIKIYPTRADAGLKSYPHIPEKWLPIHPTN